MTRVAFSVPVAGATLVIDDDVKMFSVRMGKWVVEVIGDQLIVREDGRPANATPLLKVPAS